MNYVIQCRYEYVISYGNIKWTSWFAVSAKTYSEEEADNVIAEYKKATTEVDRRTHLKHEYRKYNAALYENEIKRKYAEAEKNKEITAALKKEQKKRKK
jgi:nitrogen-specific signal transduction histidine kinase